MLEGLMRFSIASTRQKQTAHPVSKQRSKIMASSILDQVRNKRNATFQDIEATIEDQVDSLRSEIASLTKLISKNSASQSKKIRSQAESGYEDLIARSEEILEQLQDGYSRGAKEVRDTVRRHPAATIGAAAAFGLIIALLARR
jgi:ElaB/YqjD/DUF883 family membrane-anchored ribosome-binding protein